MVEFNITDYATNDYEVVTREGKPVILGAINEEVSSGHQVIGWLNVHTGWEVYAWSLQGKLYGWDGTDYPHDLFLKKKD